MSYEREDYGPWVPMTEEERAGPERIVTAEELDLLDLAQRYGADPADPSSIERARGRREVELLRNRERIMAAIREAEVHVAYGRRDREQRSRAGAGNRGQRQWHTRALEALLLEAGATGQTPAEAYRSLIAAYDDAELADDLLDAMNRATGDAVDILDFAYAYRSRPGDTVLFRLKRGEGAAVEITARSFQNAVSRLTEI